MLNPRDLIHFPQSCRAWMLKRFQFLALLLTMTGLVLCATNSNALADDSDDVSLIRTALPPQVVYDRLARYVDVDLGISNDKLPASVYSLLDGILEAAEHLDRIYWNQVSSSGHNIYETLLSSPAKAAHLIASYMSTHYGPWDRHADDETIVGGRNRPEGANFYPPDMSPRELDQWIDKHPGDAVALMSGYTVVRRKDDGLIAIPYSEVYRNELSAASNALREASKTYTCAGRAAGEEKARCPCDDLARFLEARAQSFLDDDYRTSEYLWLKSQECPLDVAIGPYEFYEDRLLGQKTSFESIVFVTDVEASAHYNEMVSHYPGFLNSLPISAALKSRFEFAEESPITIADVIYSSGEARAGYQVRAFMLPNDDVVRSLAGAKRVILRNVVQAKFDHLTKPVGEGIFSKKLMGQVSFDAHFNLLATWELAHAMIPKPIATADGTRSTSRQQLRNRHAIIQAVNGEALSLLYYFYLVDKGVLPAKGRKAIAATYLATLFDGARLAMGSPQTIARVILYNYLTEEWVVRYSPSEKNFEINAKALRDAVNKLGAETLEILARGDYDGAGHLIVRYGIVPGEFREKMNELQQLPVDIRPHYTIVEQRGITRNRPATPGNAR